MSYNSILIFTVFCSSTKPTILCVRESDLESWHVGLAPRTNVWKSAVNKVSGNRIKSTVRSMRCDSML